MKGLVVYDTTHGNTKTVAEALSEVLKESGIGVDTVHVKDAGKPNPKEYGFLVLGSPTRFGTMSFAMKRFLGKVKADAWADRPFAAFDTENPENLEKHEGSAGEKIAAQLAERGMYQAAPVLKALVLDMKGPLVESELDRVKAYGRDLAAQLKA